MCVYVCSLQSADLQSFAVKQEAGYGQSTGCSEYAWCICFYLTADTVFAFYLSSARAY